MTALCVSPGTVPLMTSVSSTLPRPRASVAWTALPDGAVLFATETEVYYALNTVGAVVWELLSGDCASLDALCTAVSVRFPEAGPGEVRADVTELLDDLLNAGLLEPR